MAKGASKVGNKAATPAPQPAPPQVTPPTKAQVAAGQILPAGGVPFNKFETMTDDQKADVINNALQTGLPMFLDDSDLQRFAYFTGMSDKPTVVSDSKLDTVKGVEIFRTVNNGYNDKTDIGYTSTDICKQVAYGDFTMYSDGGGSVHGKALYYANSYDGSKVYGDPRKNPMMMRAKITSTKIISETKLNRDYSAALKRNDKLAKACQKADGLSARNLYALAKGYDVVDDGRYKMVLNRRAITMSDTFKPATGTRWK